LCVVLFFRSCARTKEQQEARKGEKYPLLGPCSQTCRKKCSEKFSLDQREDINRTFWSFTFSERRIWFNGHIHILSVQRRRLRGSSDTVKHSRGQSLVYFLPDVGMKRSVCKVMFLHTLGLSTDGMVTEFTKCKLSKLSMYNATRRSDSTSAAGLEDSGVLPLLNVDHRVRHPPQIRLIRIESKCI